MAVNPITASMSIELPTPGQTDAVGIAAPGESWGELYNAGFNTVDQHDHTTGRGLAITSAAININGDLDFNTENLIGLRTARFDAISLGALGVTDIGCLLVSSADLYYVDTAGNQVRMTSGGAIAGAPGSISGLAAPASASYSSGPKLFSFESAADTVAGIACGPLVLTDSSVPNGKAASIQVPAGLMADYQVTMPAALPGSTLPVNLSSAGLLTAAAITRGGLPTVGQQISAPTSAFNTASGTFVDITGYSVTLTTTGRPVMVFLQGDNTGSVSRASCTNTSGNQSVQIRFLRGATEIFRSGVQAVASGGIIITVFAPPSCFSVLDTPAAGTYTYKAQILSGNGADTVSIAAAQIVAYEL